ncbi:hypothetical protein BCR35DRAFT_304357 [Leucosporidium creatinivorum]|uniref:Arrestin-like N-terminal domain-containing protein n=1 Tax=Leucosporidium creatinivorum TaxID=106004 RepID=A0A1Y2FAW9_9BASI|nr:hypothetical protein BCR35DRAFT_304357 [Leucosporidium creatinivorum]
MSSSIKAGGLTPDEEYGSEDDFEPYFRRLHHASTSSRPSSLSGRSSSTSRPTSPGLLGHLGLNGPTLEVHLLEDHLYMKPSFDENTPTSDPLLQGTVTLHLPKARTLRHLSVQVLGLQDIGWGDNRAIESSIVLDREVTLLDSLASKADDDDSAHLKLEKGEHTWEFILVIPSSTPTYERSRWGRVRHRVVAKAKGLAAFGGDIVTEERELFLKVDPGGAVSGPPPGFHARIEGRIDTSSPFGIELQSKHLMVGGLLLFRFHALPLADQPLVIASIALNIRQHFTLQSPEDATRTLNPKPDSLHVAFLDGDHPPNDGDLQSDKPALAANRKNLWSSEGGGELKFKHLARLPKDNVLRPSTFPGTKAFIKLRHTVEVEILYHLPKDGELGQRLKVSISKGLEFHNCSSYLPSLVLPEYAVRDPLPQGPSEEHPNCLCCLKLKPLIERHGKPLLVEEGRAPIPKLGVDGRTQGLVDQV